MKQVFVIGLQETGGMWAGSGRAFPGTDAGYAMAEELIKQDRAIGDKATRIFTLDLVERLSTCCKRPMTGQKDFCGKERCPKCGKEDAPPPELPPGLVDRALAQAFNDVKVAPFTATKIEGECEMCKNEPEVCGPTPKISDDEVIAEIISRGKVTLLTNEEILAEIKAIRGQ